MAVGASAAPGARGYFLAMVIATDADGYIYMSNVNPVDELVNMISASRSYQNSVEVLSTSKELLMRTLNLGS